MSSPNIITWLPVNQLLIAPKQRLDSLGISGPMALGSVTIPTTKVQSSSDIQLTLNTFGTPHGPWYVSAVVPGVSFTVTSTRAGAGTETSSVSWAIMPKNWAKGTSNSLSSGSVFVNAPSVTKNSNILLTYATNPGVSGSILSAPVANILPGVGFMIFSVSVTDTARVNWVITDLIPGLTQGTVTLGAAGATIPTTAVAANSVILLTDNTTNLPTQYVRVSAIVPGVSFTITAAANTDRSTINWAIIPGGNLVLNSNVTGGSFVYDKVIRQVQLFSTANTSPGTTFTITGIGSPVDGNGNPTQVVGLLPPENIVGLVANTPKDSTNIYQKIISISVNGPVDNVSVGSGSSGITDFVFLNTNSVFGFARCSLQFLNRVTMTATAYTSLNKPQIIDQNAGNLIDSPFLADEFLPSGSTSDIVTIPTPASVVWLAIEATTVDSLNFTVLQQGVYP